MRVQSIAQSAYLAEVVLHTRVAQKVLDQAARIGHGQVAALDFLGQRLGRTSQGKSQRQEQEEEEKKKRERERGGGVYLVEVVEEG